MLTIEPTGAVLGATVRGGGLGTIARRKRHGANPAGARPARGASLPGPASRPRVTEAVLRIFRRDPGDSGWPAPYRALAACYAHMGRLNDARAVIEQLRTLGPVMASEINRFRR